MQNENLGPLVDKLLKISRGWQQSSSETCGGLCCLKGFSFFHSFIHPSIHSSIRSSRSLSFSLFFSLSLKQKGPIPKSLASPSQGFPHALSQTRSAEPSLVSLHAGSVSAPYHVTPLSLSLPSFSHLPGPDSVLQSMILLELTQYSLPYWQRHGGEI